MVERGFEAPSVGGSIPLGAAIVRPKSVMGARHPVKVVDRDRTPVGPPVNWVYCGDGDPRQTVNLVSMTE